MTNRSSREDPTLSIEVLLRVDGIARQFETAWKRGDRPRIEDYLGEARDRERSGLLLELLCLDLEYRRKRGDWPVPREYFERFPDDREVVDTALQAAPEAPLPPAIGRYRLISWLGDGGQASVYRAVHPGLEKELILKLAHEPALDRRDGLLVEGKLLVDLEHPNIARIYDLDFDGERPFLVTEYVRGRTLRECPPRSCREIARLVAKLARALSVAHRRGVYHRDIKPDNILIDEAGEPRLIDFGLARWPHSRKADDGRPEGFSGSPPFTAPEQARNESERQGERSDVFSLGALLYWLLGEKAPFESDDWRESLEFARRCEFDRGALRRSGAPRALERICLRALASEPRDRFGSADEMARELERFALRPRRLLLLSAGVLLIATVLGGILAVLQPDGPAPLEVVDFGIEHWKQERDGSDRYVGVLGDTTFEADVEDAVRLRVELREPAYVYLVALNPDGEEQLLDPSAPMEPPAPRKTLEFPAGNHRGEMNGFFLTDGAGLQAFLLLASREPLPPYAEWSGSQAIPWSSVHGNTARWFDGDSLRPLRRRAVGKERGEVGRLDAEPVLLELWRFLSERPEFDAVQGKAIPVRARAEGRSDAVSGESGTTTGISRRGTKR